MRLLVPHQRLSLIARILLMVGGALALTYPLSVFLFINSELAFYRSASVNELTVALDTMEKAVGEQVIIGDYTLIEQILRTRVRHSHFIEADYSDNDGNVVTATDPQPAANYPNWFRSWFALPDKPVSRQIVVGGKEYGRITIWMSHIAFRNQVWQTMVQQVQLVVVVGLALFIAIAWVLKRGLKPLHTATELALSLRRGEYQCLAFSPEAAAPEIRDTLITFNDAATREAWLARFAEIISSVESPERKVRAVMALLCARLDMQGAVLAYQAFTGGLTVKVEYFADKQAERMEWEVWATQVAALGKPVMTDGHAPATTVLGQPLAYIGVPARVGSYHTAVLSLFGNPSRKLLQRNGEMELMELCADWIGTTLSQAEHDQRMREQKEHAESVLNGVMEGIVTLDQSGMIISANPAMEHIFRYPTDWVVGQNLQRFLPNVDWAFVESRLALQAAQVNMADLVWQETGKRSDGETIVMEVSARSVRRGDASLIVVVLRDVTERIRAEEALRRSEARRRRAQSIAQLGSLEYFPETGATHWSSELRHIFGMPLGADLSFKDFLLRVDHDDRERVVRAFDTGMSSSRAFNIEFRVSRPGGELRDVLLSAEAAERDEHGPKMFAVVQDLTARKQADAKMQAALVEKFQAEAHSRAKTLFLANMSHELRTPLNAILGYSDMLEEDARAEGRESVVSDLRKIQSAGKHLLAMINEVLDLSKIEAGRIDLVMEDCAPRALIDDVLSTIEPLASKNGNRLHVDCELGEDVIRTDAMKLKQVLINLLSNACKFTKEGEVRLFARREQENVRTSLSVTVEDSGIGMTTEQVDRLFVPFVQADTSTFRKYGGTGLGLAISKRFVELMGGQLTVTSVPGRGSTFSLRIPIDGGAGAGHDSTPATHVVEATTNRTAPSRSGERRSQIATVLVVENDPALRELIERYLSGEGFRVVSIENSAEIEIIARAYRPLLIVLDTESPHAASSDIVTRLKADPSSGDIPLVLVGGGSEIREAQLLGAVDYLEKPMNWPMLGAVAKKWARVGGAQLDIAPAGTGRVMAGGKPGS